jgi:tetratricopeptide (TPR) repeat protein
MQSPIRPALAILAAMSLLPQTAFPGSNADVGRPDALIKASTMAAHAEELVAACSFRAAEDWTRRAIDAVRSSRYQEATDRDTAGALDAQLEIRLKTLQNRRKELDDAASALPRLVAANRLTTADERMRSLQPPLCFAALHTLNAELQTKLRVFRSVVARGDQALDRRDGTESLKYYQRALELNREAQLSQRIEAARQMKREHHGASAGKRVFSTILVLGLIGGGAYAAAQERNRARSGYR